MSNKIFKVFKKKIQKSPKKTNANKGRIHICDQKSCVKEIAFEDWFKSFSLRV